MKCLPTVEGYNEIKLDGYPLFRKTCVFWKAFTAYRRTFYAQSTNLLMLISLWSYSLWLCHGSPCHSLKYIGKLLLPVLTAALCCELGNRASIPVDFAAPAVLHRLLRAVKHQGLLQLCPQPGEQFIVNNSIGFFFSLFIMNYLWTDGYKELIQPSELLHKCFYSKKFLSEASALTLSWLFIPMKWAPSLLRG